MVTRKKNGEAPTSPKNKNENCTTIVAEKTPQIQSEQVLRETNSSLSENKFNSLEEFKSFVKDVFINKSDIAPELYAESVEFHQSVEWSAGMDAETPIHDELGWYFARFTHQVEPTIYAAFLRNEDGTLWQAIVSLWDEERQRPYRYLAPKKNGDRAFFPPVPTSIRKKIASRYGVEVPMDGSFWDWLASAKIPRIVTEGAKKSLAALSQGYCAIALYGCRCGGGKSKDDDGMDLEPRLTSDLERLATENSIWLLAMDRDDSHKAKISVTKGKKRLTEALRTACSPYLEDIVWRTEQGKGIDDLIVNNGSGAFDRVYADAIARLEKKFKAGTPGQYDEPEKQKNPPPDQQAKIIAEDYRQLIAFNDETKLWMRYEADSPGVWSPESNEFMESIIYKILASDNIQNFGSDYVTNVLKLLRHELIERRWNEVSPRDWLPFTNGVVEIATGKLHKHAPGFRLTWTLPRDYSDTPGKWDNINNFLEHLSDGNPNIKELLICFCNAVLKGRYDLQKFLHLIGLGGTGKGTFARLVTELIGARNVLISDLPVWCTNQFEGYNAFGKRLVVFPEVDLYKGSIGRFLSLTGGDKVRAEEKGKKSFNFDYQGMTLVCSNFPIFVGGSSSRAKRRTITVPCNRKVTERDRRELSDVFEPELSAFTLYLLTLDDGHVSRILKGEKEIPQCTLEFWENQMKGDSVSSWINDCIVYDANAVTQIGNDRNEGNNGTPRTLFGSYVAHCLKTGGSPKSSRTFSPDLIETCHTILNWPISKEINKKGTFIRGLRLRLPGLDEEIPTYDHWLNQRISADEIQGDISGGGLGGGSGGGSDVLPCKDSGGLEQNTPMFRDIPEDISDIYISSPKTIQPGDTILIKDAPVPEWNGLREEVKFVSPNDSGGIITVTGKGLPFRCVEKCATENVDNGKPELIGTTQTIHQLGNKSVKFESGEYVRTYDDICHLRDNPIVSGCPEIKIGGVYYSPKLKSTIKIKKYITTKGEWICHLPKAVEEVRVTSLEIRATENSPMTSIKIGDTVKSIGKIRKGKEGVVDKIDTVVWVRFPGERISLSFYSHQLKIIAKE